MQTSRHFAEAVARGLKLKPRFWYDCALCAFTDVVLLLQVYGPQEYDTRKIRQVTGWFEWLSSLADRQLYYMQPRNPMDVASRLELLRRHRAGGLSCCEDRVDRSFHDPALLAECLRDEDKARHTAQCFKLLAPFGVPPAQYCFASQLALHHLTIVFLASIATGDEQDDVLEDIKSQFTLIPPNAVDSRARSWMHRVTLEHCSAVLAAPMGTELHFWADGSGPRCRPSAAKGESADIDSNTQLQRAFELVDLDAMVRQHYEYAERGARERLAGVYAKVVHAQLRYAAELPEEWPVWDDNTPMIDRDELLALRESTLKRYGTYDPLQWSVLLAGEEDAFGLVTDWKRVLVDAIATTKAVMDPESEPVLQLQCRACGNTARCGVESSAPYGAYCDGECQKRGYGQ